MTLHSCLWRPPSYRQWGGGGVNETEYCTIRTFTIIIIACTSYFVWPVRNLSIDSHTQNLTPEISKLAKTMFNFVKDAKLY